MKIFRIVIVLMIASVLVVSCKTEKKEMTLKDYAKIEMEINLPDPELDKEMVSKVTEEYGYTYEQYKQMHEKVLNSPELQEKLGELRLQKQQQGTEM